MRPDQPTETVQRRSTDALWFAVLFVSIATGIGMTIFAPVGDAPQGNAPKGGAIGTASTMPTEDPFTAATTTSPTTGSTTTPTTVPAL